MPVNILNLAGLDVVDFKKPTPNITFAQHPRQSHAFAHIAADPTTTVVHAKRTLVIRVIPSHGKAVVIHLDVSR